MPLLVAVAAPRASQRNTAAVSAEPEFITTWGPALTARGHTFTSVAEIGAVTAIERRADYESSTDPATGETTARLRVDLENGAPASGLPSYVIGNEVGKDRR